MWLFKFQPLSSTQEGGGGHLPGSKCVQSVNGEGWMGKPTPQAAGEEDYGWAGLVRNGVSTFGRGVKEANGVHTTKLHPIPVQNGQIQKQHNTNNFLVYFSCSHDELFRQKQFKGERISFGSQFKGSESTVPEPTLGSVLDAQEGIRGSQSVTAEAARGAFKRPAL